MSVPDTSILIQNFLQNAMLQYTAKTTCSLPAITSVPVERPMNTITTQREMINPNNSSSSVRIIPQDNNVPCIPITVTEQVVTYDPSQQNLFPAPVTNTNDVANPLQSSSVLPQNVFGGNPNLIQGTSHTVHQPIANPSQGIVITSSIDRQNSSTRLNKFVRRLHDMLQAEKGVGIVEWRRGLLVLQNTDAFAKRLLPKYFNTRNFKTFRRQLNYYGFVHVRSFSTAGSSTTALWVNRELAQITEDDSIESVLLLKRVEPCETAKTVEGRRFRKELAISTVEEEMVDVSAKRLQLSKQEHQQVNMLTRLVPMMMANNADGVEPNTVPIEIHCSMQSGDHNNYGTSSDTDSTYSGYCSCIPRRSSCDTASTVSTIGVVSQQSNDCMTMSEQDDSTCAANLLLMLSRTA